MYATYLKLAFRNLLKNKTFSAINLLGLTTGTVCCLYILLYVQDQRSYDKHHHEAGNLFRITTELNLPDGNDIMPMATCSPPIAPALGAEFPEVEAAARVCSPPGVEQNHFRVGERVFSEKKGYYADSTFFRIFDYHFLAGDPQHALDEPYSVVISEQLAIKLFNTSDVLNQTVGIGGESGEEKFKITGVFNDALGNTHLLPAFFKSMNSGGIGGFVRSDDSWAGNNFIYAYLRLRPGADVQALEAKLPAFLQRHGGEQLQQLHIGKTLHLQPVPAIHTDASLISDIGQNTSKGFLNMLLLVAGFIQLVACINFMNLSTARATRRAQEVGIRKSVGAGRGSLIGQFLSEGMLLAVLAVALALPLVYMALPWLNQLTGAEVTLHLYQNASVWLMVAGMALFTGLVAGSYPAFYLSSFQPVSILKGITSMKSGKNAGWLRKGLVVSQFVISAVLIIGALVVQSQLRYMLSLDLGFERSQKIVIPFRSEESRARLQAFRNELVRYPEVRSASAMAVCPGQMIYNDVPMYKPGSDMKTAIDIRYTQVDENYLKTLKIKLLAGRFVTSADTSAVIEKARVVLNEKALKQLGIPVEEAPGVVLHSDIMGRHLEFTIIGVMQDFLYQNLGKKLDPFMVMAAAPAEFAHVVVDVHTEDYAAFLAKTETVWKNVLHDVPFEYSFLDEDFARLYKTEQTLSRIISAFTLMAILISCLGLLGLSIFTAEQRRKEIGIRKVLGASVAGITSLLARDFLKLVLLAFLIASPVAWYGMNLWLDDFAYRTHIEWWVFALAGTIAVAVAFLTVGFQSVRAALANPVKSLRSE